MKNINTTLIVLIGSLWFSLHITASEGGIVEHVKLLLKELDSSLDEEAQSVKQYNNKQREFSEALSDYNNKVLSDHSPEAVRQSFSQLLSAIEDLKTALYSYESSRQQAEKSRQKYDVAIEPFAAQEKKKKEEWWKERAEKEAEISDYLSGPW